MADIKILAGDWEKPYKFIITPFSGKKPTLSVMKGMEMETFNKYHIASIDMVNEETKNSVLAKAGWGAAGAVVLGPLGLLAGVLGGGNKRKTVVSVVLKDGRKALLECDPKTLKKLLSLMY